MAEELSSGRKYLVPTCMTLMMSLVTVEILFKISAVVTL